VRALYFFQKMIQRIVSVWIAVGSSAAVAFLCFILADNAARSIRYRSGELPRLSELFYPDAMLVYFFPLPLCMWALSHTLRSPDDRDQSILIVTATLSLLVVFLTVFALALALPYIPLNASVLQ
jgi:hypothetical protein